MYIKRVTKYKRTVGKPTMHVYKDSNILQKFYKWLMSVDYDTGTFVEGKEEPMTLDDLLIG